MDRALWLLLGLRLRGWLRRLRKALSTVRGILVALFGLGMFTLWLVPLIMLAPAGTNQSAGSSPLRPARPADRLSA